MAKDCWSKKKSEKSNTATSNQKNDSDEEQEVEASVGIEEDELALAVTIPDQINYESDWIIDSECSNHMTGDKDKLHDMTEYKGSRVVVTTDNSRLPITHVSNTILAPRYSPQKVALSRCALCSWYEEKSTISITTNIFRPL